MPETDRRLTHGDPDHALVIMDSEWGSLRLRRPKPARSRSSEGADHVLLSTRLHESYKDVGPQSKLVVHEVAPASDDFDAAMKVAKQVALWVQRGFAVTIHCGRRETGVCWAALVLHALWGLSGRDILGYLRGEPEVAELLKHLNGPPPPPCPTLIQGTKAELFLLGIPAREHNLRTLPEVLPYVARGRVSADRWVTLQASLRDPEILHGEAGQSINEFTRYRYSQREDEFSTMLWEQICFEPWVSRMHFFDQLARCTSTQTNMLSNPTVPFWFASGEVTAENYGDVQRRVIWLIKATYSFTQIKIALRWWAETCKSARAIEWLDTVQSNVEMPQYLKHVYARTLDDGTEDHPRVIRYLLMLEHRMRTTSNFHYDRIPDLVSLDAMLGPLRTDG